MPNQNPLAMKRTARSITALLLLALIALPPALAQKRGKKNTRRKARTEKIEEKHQAARQMMQDYRFEEAAGLLQDMLEELEDVKDTDSIAGVIENELQLAGRGAQMLRGTERITIVDSMVVDSNDFFKCFRLSEGAGTIAHPTRFLFEDTPKGCGQAAYLNDFEDAVIFAAPDTAGILKLFAAHSTSQGWGTPMQLDGIGSAADVQDFPFLMPDGVTLYFAAQGEESLGGYDIFVTRHSNESGKYLKAENVGMPFNSPANDYLMVIDEATRLGWFVSDRNQPAGKVCIYCFVPNASREVYDMTAENEAAIRRLARIDRIAESRTDKQEAAAAMKRLAGLDLHRRHKSTGSHHFVINDDVVYGSLNDFRSEEARQQAAIVLSTATRLEEATRQLQRLRGQYARNRHEAFAAEIEHLEQEVAQLRPTLRTAEKAMRKAELDAQ